MYKYNNFGVYSTSTSSLIAKAEMENTLASIGRTKIGRLLWYRTIARMLGDFLQHQTEQPRSQFGSHFLKVQYAYWDSEREIP